MPDPAAATPGAAAAAGDPVAEAVGFPCAAGVIDLRLRAGELVHVRGGNGSGKTSLLRSLAGLPAPLRPQAVRVLGQDPATLGARALAGVVRALWATPRATLVGLTLAGEARLRRLPLPARLAAWADRDVATLSPGEARQAEIAFAAASPAPLLLLDEPCAGLDPEGLAALERLVAAARATGAVAVADHTGWAAALADRVVDLGGAQPAPWPSFGPAKGATVVAAAACTVRRGATRLDLPAVAWPGGLHGVAGPNGAGKTTLLRRLAGLGDTKGVRIRDEPPRPGANVTLLLSEAGDLLHGDTVRQALGAAAPTAPPELVPEGLLHRHPASLSAGEAQRVALAKALASDAPALLLDEPEAHLDAAGRAHLAQAVQARVAEGACVAVATHDAGLRAAAASRLALGRRGPA